ncbi:uncharacterized protein TRIVIDRAFT_10277, partial [Trichoderma virens Gv29-8]
MSRSFRRGLLTAAAVWAASAAAGNEWKQTQDNDNQWLASTVVVTSTVLVDLKDAGLKCKRGEIVCNPTPPPIPDPKHCPECQKWPRDPVDVFHGLWEGCSGDHHCPNGCNCSSKAICETVSDGSKCKSSTACPYGYMCNSYGFCQPLPGPRCHEKACVIDHGPKCTTNKDCSHGEVCNHWGFCQKVVFPDCEKNSDCKHGQICTQRGICKTIDEPQCRRDSDCKDGQICNSQRICQDADCVKCKQEHECHHDEYCKENVCKPKDSKCKDNRDCKDGEICDWEGKCRRGEHFQCRVDSDCKFGQICDIHGKCQKRPAGPICGSDRDCKDDKFCNAYGYCEKKRLEDCSEDMQCLPGEICSSGKCLPKIGCHTDGDCRKSEVCEHHICVFHKVCKTDGDCKGDEQCKDHRCKKETKKEAKWCRCNYDADCQRDETCEDHKCEKMKSCHYNDDCARNEICKDHKCKKMTSCDFDADCKRDETCKHHKCIKKKFCNYDADCERDEACRDHMCDKVRSCNYDADCERDDVCKEHKCEKKKSCNYDTECERDEVCREHKCEKSKACYYDADCGRDELCRNGECFIKCNYERDCKGNETCDGGVCIRKKFCDTAIHCDDGQICLDNYCEKIPKCGNDFCDVCTPGFKWSHYKLARSTDDSKTLKGMIPIHNTDVQSLENWPILQFKPQIALDGQIPDFTGLTDTLGIEETCPPEHAHIYNTDVGSSVDYTIVQHIGYFIPKQLGTYSFKANAPVPDQSLYVWIGEKAQQGWINTNADLIADATWSAGSNTFLKVVLPTDIGKYIPIRILYVNAQDCGEFALTIQGPTGEVLVSRDQKTTDGQFVSNCPEANDIPPIDF